MRSRATFPPPEGVSVGAVRCGVCPLLRTFFFFRHLRHAARRIQLFIAVSTLLLGRSHSRERKGIGE